MEEQAAIDKHRRKLKEMKSSDKKLLEQEIIFLLMTDRMKEEKAKAYKQQLKRNDQLALLFAMLGILLNILSSSYYMNFDLKITKVENEDYNRILLDHFGIETPTVTYLRISTSISTVVLVILLVRHYFILRNIGIYTYKLTFTSKIYSSKFIWKIFIEILICAIHSPPSLDNFKISVQTLDGTYVDADVDFFLSSWILLRMYLIFKYFAFNSKWAEVEVEKICNDFYTEGGILFAVKAEFNDNPYLMVLISISITIFVFGYALRNIELAFSLPTPENMFHDWSNSFNGFWCIVITILTVGYGDLYPQTVLGKIIAVMSCLCGTVLISLMIVTMTFSVEFTSQEEKAFFEIRTKKKTEELNQIASQLIRQGVRISFINRKMENSLSTRKSLLKESLIPETKKFKSLIKLFNSKRKGIMSQTLEKTAETILMEINDNNLQELFELINLSSEGIFRITEIVNKAVVIQNLMDDYTQELDYIIESFIDAAGIVL